MGLVVGMLWEKTASTRFWTLKGYEQFLLCRPGVPHYPQLAGAVLLWDRLLTEARSKAPFYSEFVPEKKGTASAAPLSGPSATVASSQPLAARPDQASSSAEGPAWLRMPLEARAAWIRGIVTATIAKIVGRDVSPQEPLMSAGLDSLGNFSQSICTCV